MTKELIERLEELEKKATPGPWRFRPEIEQIVCEQSIVVYETNTNESDADLICALRNALPELLALARDGERFNWMEKNLCRAGEVKNSAGQTVKLARVWSIMGELETLRETVDAVMKEGR